MNKPLLEQYQLEKGGFIYVFFGQKIAFSNTEKDDEPVFLTGIPAEIVKTLLQKQNEVVSYKDLYLACYGGSEPTEDFQNQIQQHVFKLHKLLGKKIDNYHNKGYLLGVKKNKPIYQIKDNSKDVIPPTFYPLAGEYIAFYPNPQKNKLLGAYIQIRKHEDCMTANAIFDIPSNKALKRVLELFSGDSDYSRSIALIQSEFAEINMKCWFTGTLKNRDQYIATLVLKSKLDNDKRNIVLDISDFLNTPDRKFTEDRDQYRGGLGLVITGGRTDWGFAAYRIVLIRKSWFNISSMGIGSKEILHHLKATNYVNVNSDIDHNFYTWLLIKDSLLQTEDK